MFLTASVRHDLIFTESERTQWWGKNVVIERKKAAFVFSPAAAAKTDLKPCSPFNINRE